MGAPAIAPAVIAITGPGIEPARQGVAAMIAADHYSIANDGETLRLQEILASFLDLVDPIR
jgi:hypothetical protein